MCFPLRLALGVKRLDPVGSPMLCHDEAFGSLCHALCPLDIVVGMDAGHHVAGLIIVEMRHVPLHLGGIASHIEHRLVRWRQWRFPRPERFAILSGRAWHGPMSRIRRLGRCSALGLATRGRDHLLYLAAHEWPLLSVTHNRENSSFSTRVRGGFTALADTAYFKSVCRSAALMPST